MVDFTAIRLLKSEFRCVTYVLCETLSVTQTGRKSPLALLHLSLKTKEAHYHRSTTQYLFSFYVSRSYNNFSGTVLWFIC